MRIDDKLKNLLNRARLPRSLESVKFGDLLADIAEDAVTGAEGVTTDIQCETGEYFVNTSEVARNLKEFCTGMAGVQSYYETPMRVGTWAVGDDAIPIWRAAFKIDFKDIDVATYNKIVSAKMITLEDVEYIPIKDQTSAAWYIMDSNGAMARAASDPALADTIAMVEVGTFIDLADLSLPTAQGRNEYFVYGWVEFATPETNVKTG